ncbi:unnamed protein product [Closterium sp. Naga37s-1]|nr:unnamed protein product [Closterium sp. Naga37s-1]
MRRVLKVRVGGVTTGQDRVKRRRMSADDGGDDDVQQELSSGGGVLTEEAQQGSGVGVVNEEPQQESRVGVSNEETHEDTPDGARGGGEAEEVADIIGIKWADVDTLFEFDPHPIHAPRDNICTDYIRESAVELLGVDEIGDARGSIEAVAEVGEEGGSQHNGAPESAMGRTGKRWQEKKSGKRPRDDDGEDDGGTDTVERVVKEWRIRVRKATRVKRGKMDRVLGPMDWSWVDEVLERWSKLRESGEGIPSTNADEEGEEGVEGTEEGVELMVPVAAEGGTGTDAQTMSGEEEETGGASALPSEGGTPYVGDPGTGLVVLAMMCVALSNERDEYPLVRGITHATPPFSPCIPSFPPLHPLLSPLCTPASLPLHPLHSPLHLHLSPPASPSLSPPLHPLLSPPAFPCRFPPCFPSFPPLHPLLAPPCIPSFPPLRSLLFPLRVTSDSQGDFK